MWYHFCIIGSCIQLIVIWKGEENGQSEKAKSCQRSSTSRDTLDGAYPGLVLGINAARLGMETKVFYTFMGY